MIQVRFLIVLLLLIVFGATTALIIHNSKQSSVPTGEQTVLTETVSPLLPPPKPESTITTNELIGQHFIIGHWANTPVASTTAIITEYDIGGVIIMSAPADPAEIKSWTTAWQAASAQPLIIAIDQEGGQVSRLKGESFIQTSQREITSTSSAYEVGKTRGLELSALGINMNFAPVLDRAEQTNSFMYERVFPDQTRSAILAAEMLNGMSESSILGVVKHFPGHPDTSEDSHSLLPIINIERDELDEFTTPFRELIKINSPAAIMTGHLLFPQIDNKPTTLSHFFLTEYLREELNFAGVIITDDMIMEAITASSTSAAASVEALQAGADMVLFAAEPTEVSQAIEATKDALDNDSLTESELQESYGRIKTLKQNF